MLLKLLYYCDDKVVYSLENCIFYCIKKSIDCLKKVIIVFVGEMGFAYFVSL